MLFGLLIELHVGLHSCLCFSHLEKLLLNAGSTPPRYLAVCRASSAFSYRNPDSSSTPGGSIENASASSTARLIDWDSVLLSLVCSSIPSRHLHLSTFYSLDTCLDTFRSIEILLHAFHFSLFCIFFSVSIASCFSFLVVLWFHVLLVPFLSFFCLSPVMSFGFLCPLTIVSKRGRNLRIECHSSGGVINLGGELHVKRKKVFDVTNLGGELVWYTLLLIYFSCVVYLLVL